MVSRRLTSGLERSKVAAIDALTREADVIRWLATTVFLVAAAGTAAAECQVGRFGFAPAQTSETTMSVGSGQSCGVIVHAGPNSRFDSVAIAAQPRNGSLVSRSGVGFTYRSRPGYRGPDSFSFTITGRMARGTGTATIRVSVNVR